jgi:DNA repair protein RecO (recombination protein O)
VSLYRDEGVVLRVQKLGEADRIITVLTRRHGRVRAVAKGVRRTRSKFGATVEPFSHVDLQLYAGRSLDIVVQAESLTAYGGDLVTHYGRYTAGTAVLETAERLTAEEREPSLRLFLLVVGALRALTGGGRDDVPARDPSSVLDAFLLRAMTVAGYAPALTDCARCGSAGPHRAFSIPAGGTVCPACRPAGAASPAPAALMLMVDLLTGDWDAVERADPSARKQASGLVSAHLQWHLERGLRSLPLVDRS